MCICRRHSFSDLFPSMSSARALDTSATPFDPSCFRRFSARALGSRGSTMVALPSFFDLRRGRLPTLFVTISMSRRRKGTAEPSMLMKVHLLDRCK